jgi:hypothetical protein
MERCEAQRSACGSKYRTFLLVLLGIPRFQSVLFLHRERYTTRGFIM